MRTPRQPALQRPQVIFLHIGWAREYRGAADDPSLGKFGYIVEEGGEATGETLNFRPYRNYCYGYAPHSNINLSRLGAAHGADHVDNILVIWTATDPAAGGRYIVGWYKKARLYAEMDNRRPSRRRPEAIARASFDDCHLVAESQRTFYVPSMVKGWPGQRSAFYASDTLSQNDLDEVVAYVEGKPSDGFLADETDGAERSAKRGRGNRNQDPETRALVEDAAVKLVTAHYRDMGWAVTSVEHENNGWDLNVSRSRRVLRVEVKGLAGEGGVELTPGEYKAMLADATRMSYRLAVVWNTLSAQPKLTIFEYMPSSKTWLSSDGQALRIKEMTGAVVRF